MGIEDIFHCFLFTSVGCLSEKWNGKKGDTASSGQKKTKKKDGKNKKNTKTKKRNKDTVEQEMENMEPEAKETLDQAKADGNVQKVAPLSHNADEL